MPSWGAAIEEAYASAPADEYMVRTLELLHPSFVDISSNPDSIRVAIDNQAWTLTLESTAPLFAGQAKVFDPLSIDVSMPDQKEGNLGELKIGLDNIPRDIWDKLRSAAVIRASAHLIYREWVATRDLITGVYSVSGPPDMIIDQLSVKIVTATRLRIEGTATFLDLLNRGFPRLSFSRDAFPGLFGGT